jgi:hypothetical protein
LTYLQEIEDTLEAKRKRKKQEEAPALSSMLFSMSLSGRLALSHLRLSSDGGKTSCPEGYEAIKDPETGEIVCVKKVDESVTVRSSDSFEIDWSWRKRSNKWGWWVETGTPRSSPVTAEALQAARAEQVRQQNEFAECAATANNSARWHAFENIVIQETGMVQVKAGILYTVLFGSHVSRSVQTPSSLGTGLNVISDFKDTIHPGLAKVGVGFAQIGYAWRSQYQALQNREKAIADCVRKSPLANHSMAFLNF